MLFTSCSILKGVNSKEFVFYKNEKKSKLLFRLPKIKGEESFRLGDNGAKEQFYYINDGSVFYVAWKTTWPTVNSHRITGMADKSAASATFSGRHDDGHFWKEVQFDDFRMGYAYVESDHLEKFNEALNSVKIRR
jgi:hypothetical protein